MTAIVYFLSQQKYTIDEIYSYVAKVGKKYGYKGTRGTPFITIRKIFHEVLKKFKLPKAYVKYGKNLGFTFKTIQKELGKGNPLILSLNDDGRDYYENHSITVIGYEIYKCGSKEIIMLAVQDNWYKSVGYVDFDKMSAVSSVHYSGTTPYQKLMAWRKLKNLK